MIASKTEEFPFYKQSNKMDCGPTCLRMIASFYGKNLDHQWLIRISKMNSAGASFLGISDAAKKIGFKSKGLSVTHEYLKEITLPVIIHWNQRHFVVLFKLNKDRYYIADPAKGILIYNKQKFLTNWYRSIYKPESNEGAILILSVTPGFYN